MKKLLKVMLVVSLFTPVVPLMAAPGHSHDDHSDAKSTQGKSLTVSGEVLDMACYMGHEGKGKKHKKCAEDCILKNHQPIGLLTDDGDVYLLVEDHAKRKPYISLKEKASKTVSVTGKVFKRGGVQAIVVTKVQ